jgi:hypothetical protein
MPRTDFLQVRLVHPQVPVSDLRNWRLDADQPHRRTQGANVLEAKGPHAQGLGTRDPSDWRRATRHG